MAHYVSRLDTRTSTTPSEWLKICSQIGQVVNTWARRNDIVVYAGTDAGMGHTACYVKSVAEMEINLEVAFGKGATPELVGDFTQRTTQYDWAVPTGIIFHEGLHARFSEWEQSALDAMDEKVFITFSLLDESRIERLGIINHPENAVFLRSSALEIALADVNESLSTLSHIRGVAYLCALSLARVDSGVLYLSDVRATYDKVLELIGKETFDKFRAIWTEFQKLDQTEVAKGEQLAKDWNALLDELDPEPETEKGGCKFPSGSGGESGDDESESGKGSGKRPMTPDELQELIDALTNDADETMLSANQEVNEQQLTEQQQEQLSKKQERQKEIQKSKNQASKVFSKETGNLGTSGSSSILTEQRNPTGNERASAVKIAQMLEKAKYRERSITDVRSVLPQGRLKTRIAIQNLAMKSKGVMAEVPAWERTIRKHTDDPTLSIGVMVDVSGSMGGAMDAMATTAWVLSESGRRVQARTAMVYYGSGVFPTLKVGQKLEKVSVYTAPDGTELFGQAWDALDGHLGLTFTSGVKLLVIVSDGQYTPSETTNAKRTLEMCKQNGVAVLWIVPKGCSNRGTYLVGNNGVVLDQMDTDGIAMAIGKSATNALTKIAIGG